MKLSPSILSADFTHLARDIEKAMAGGTNVFHIDVMDGAFVPNISIGLPVLKSIRKQFPTVELDVHLMIEHPEQYFEEFIKAGADYLTFHIEATNHPQRALTQIRELGAKAGIALNPHTPLTELTYLLDVADLVLIMSVNPGFGGQGYIKSATEKIRSCKEMIEKQNTKTIIEVDGGVTLQNAKEVLEAGANMLVAGSAVFGKSDATQAVKDFLAMA